MFRFCASDCPAVHMSRVSSDQVVLPHAWAGNSLQPRRRRGRCPAAAANEHKDTKIHNDNHSGSRYKEHCEELYCEELGFEELNCDETRISVTSLAPDQLHSSRGAFPMAMRHASSQTCLHTQPRTPDSPQTHAADVHAQGKLSSMVGYNSIGREAKAVTHIRKFH